MARGLDDKSRLAKEQAGFRHREECIGQVVTLLESVFRRTESGSGTILLFIDFKKAYDTADHNALFYKLSMKGVPDKTILFLQTLYEKSKMIVVTGAHKSRPILVRKGVRQGCPGSPCFFDVYMSMMTWQWNYKQRGLRYLKPTTSPVFSRVYA